MSKAGAGEFVTMQVLKEMLAMQDRGTDPQSKFWSRTSNPK